MPIVLETLRSEGVHIMVSVGEEGEGHSMQRDRRQKKVWEPTVESVIRGIWRLRVSEAERRVREGV